MRNEAHRGLPRLESEHYLGQAYVHWTMTIQNRKTGWLIPIFNYKFREILTHAAFRYAFACPVYCLMPDHMHFLWIGIDDRSDQLKASEYFRKRLGEPLEKMGCSFQHQPYDHVLKDEERLETDVNDLCEYIARNPERKNLVGVDEYKKYPYTGCLVPGYPELISGSLISGRGSGAVTRFCARTACSVRQTKNSSDPDVATVARRWIVDDGGS